jgi:hypothetical protein
VYEAYGDDELVELEARIDGWFASIRSQVPQIAAVDRGEDDLIRWFVRLVGDEKDFTTIWFTLGQRTLRYETYVMPAPEENAALLYEHVLRRNNGLVGAHFSIGEEDALFLRGEIPTASVDEAELDRIIGTVFATVEATFRPLLRIGFASRFGG